MLKTLRSFGEHPGKGRHVQLPGQAALAHRGVAEGHLPLREDRLFDEVESVGELNLLVDRSATDPRPDFAEHRTIGGEERLEVECAVERRQCVFQYGPGQFEDGLSFLALDGKHD